LPQKDAKIAEATRLRRLSIFSLPVFAMKLFVGLGNPGRAYAGNRHNIGFMAVDAILRRHPFAPLRARFQGQAAEGAIGRERMIALKPQTFMNDSGRSVGEAMRYYKIELDDIVVFHDELDLVPGRLRVKIGGGNAGHNGLRSISEHIGNDYRRVRIGIGHPGDKDLVHDYVLSNFSKAEMEWVAPMCDAIATNAEFLAEGQDASFQNKIFLAMREAGLNGDADPIE
jgi:peptidyl-tRNA hydrolase, PTH1 family